MRIMLTSRQPIWIGWGDELTYLYNDPYKTIIGGKHPWALAQPFAQVWREIWDVVGPMADIVMRRDEGTYVESQRLIMERHGYPEETYYTFSYSPIPNPEGGPGGLICANTDDTRRVIGERQLALLRELAAGTADARTTEEAALLSARCLETNPYDLPFALIYLVDAAQPLVRLAGTAGIAPGTAGAPEMASPDTASPWPFAEVIEAHKTCLVADLRSVGGTMPAGAWNCPPHQAVAVPIAASGRKGTAGVLIAGLNPFRRFDDSYLRFFELIATQIAAALANACAYEEERERAESLAELDRAKTAFFSNVSHEFRTPLTLMLGPVEDMLARSYTELPPASKSQLEVINRNGLRLLRLVNTLLDFSRIEAGRVRAVYQPTDLTAFTADLASVFRSACERAGLRLVVDCPKLAEPVFVDRDMWEKIVLNLLSNAFKFTFEGEIAVTLRQTGEPGASATGGPAVELRVKDTGTGIPAEEMPRLFERFHRVENARGRTHEGSGIGLALVQELVKLHGGSVTAESVVGQGTTFTVRVPLGSAHLPREQIGEGRTLASTATGAAPFVEEALRWLPDEGRDEDGGRSELPTYPESLSVPYRRPEHDADDDRPRVLMADDNADMRQYVVRLLAEHYRVEEVPDGEAALASIRKHPPDLILTDVMMPRLDGLGLLREVRADPSTRGVPLILLSARAGEESRVEGMEAGADDYMVKPFGARELLARVGAHLQMARLRREAGESLRRSEERFQSFMRNSPMTAFIKDEEGYYLYVNRALEEKFKRPRDEWIGKTDLDIFPAEEAEQYRQNDRSVLASRRTAEVVETATREDGLHYFLSYKFPLQDEEGRWLLAGLSLDITEHKRAEEALQTAEQRWRTMAEALPNLLWTDLPDGQCDWLSSQWGQYTGIPEQELLGLRWLDTVLHPDDRERTLACWRAACADEADYDLEYRIRRYDGEYHWFKTRGVPIRDEQGKIIYWFGTCTDIEDVKRMEAALREADRRKDEFLATLAHELRNPLAPLRNGLQVMKLARNNTDALEQTRAMMERQLGQMVRLIDDLLDMSRISQGKIELRKERVVLTQIIQQAVETSRPLIESSGHDLTIHVPSAPVYVDADVTHLAQAFANLLNNAAKYTPRGGRVTLTVERQNSEAVVSVRDTGVGIPAHMLPRVFEMFTQVDRSLEQSQGGLGIGLSLVKKLVEMHGGSVEAQSDGHGMGSEFVVRLPVVLSLAGPPRDKDSEGGGATARRRILVVDDNRDAAISLAMMLRLMGNETQTAHDGQEALELAAAFRPDVVLLDIGMPKLNGYEVARRIREQSWGKNLVLVAVTGWGQDDDRRRSRESGFNVHMVKPVDPAKLEKLLAELQATTG